jgi:hypothetical protein
MATIINIINTCMEGMEQCTLDFLYREYEAIYSKTWKEVVRLVIFKISLEGTVS